MKIGLNALGAISQDTGGRNYLINFVCTCVELGVPHQFFIFYSGPKEDIWGPLPPNYQKITIPKTNISSMTKALGEQVLLPLWIFGRKLDVIYFPSNFVTVLIAKPKVVAIRSALYYHLPQEVPPFQRVYRKILSRLTVHLANKIIVPSESLRRDVIAHMGAAADRIHVAPHGVDGRLFGARVSQADLKARLDALRIQQPYFLFVSALWPYKGAHRFLEAFEIVYREAPINGVIAGRGIASEKYYRRLKELIRCRGLDKAVRMVGDLSHAELATLYWGATAPVFPSYCESFGNPLVEAMAAGTPIIASNRHAVPETVGDAGLIVDPDDVNGLAAAMRRILQDEKLRMELVERGRQRAAKFSWPQAVKATLAIIEEVALCKA